MGHANNCRALLYVALKIEVKSSTVTDWNVTTYIAATVKMSCTSDSKQSPKHRDSFERLRIPWDAMDATRFKMRWKRSSSVPSSKSSSMVVLW